MCAYVPYSTKYQGYQLRHTKRWAAVHQKDKAQITTRAKFKCSRVKVALLRHLKNIYKYNIHKITRVEQMHDNSKGPHWAVHTAHIFLLEVEIRCILCNIAPSL
jgi:hypothetical protein